MSTSRRVQLAKSGLTPKKVQTFNKEEPSSYVPLATPTRSLDFTSNNNNGNSLKSSLRNIDAKQTVPPAPVPTSADISYSRPKTSRGTSRPSPDEFASYVVPSPNRDDPYAVTTAVDHSQSSRIQVHGNSIDKERRALFTHVLSEKDVYIGCWLFGSLLRV